MEPPPRGLHLEIEDGDPGLLLGRDRNAEEDQCDDGCEQPCSCKHGFPTSPFWEIVDDPAFRSVDYTKLLKGCRGLAPCWGKLASGQFYFPSAWTRPIGDYSGEGSLQKGAAPPKTYFWVGSIRLAPAAEWPG